MIIIIILGGLVVLFATNKINFNSNVIDENTTQENGDTTKDELEDNENIILTESEAITALKTVYNEAVRHIFNQEVAYCGETEGILDLNGFLYYKSTSFDSFAELESYLKKYMTNKLLSTSNYNKVTTLNGVEVNSYYEKDGNLYCNTWNKGGNVSLSYYQESESIFEITNIEDNSFTATINAVYYDVAKENKTTKKMNVVLVKNNDIWLMDSYEEVQ